MLKRGVDVIVSGVGLALSSVVIVPVAVAVWLQDFKSPFYLGPRVAKGGGIFKMVKLRSMVSRADTSGVDSTSATDPRITPVGRFIRAYKLDEITQLWNVLWGQMSLVGPRPQVRRDAEMYTAEEKRLLSIRPGITDFSSIVFADEGEILKGRSDPDLAYHQLIRPWKSRLGLFYVENASLLLDLRLIWLTAVAIVSRRRALEGVHAELVKRHAPYDLAQVALRTAPLEPSIPPGGGAIVISRDL
jgi:lipopolysaccharide/colanic/teichoic acid biosynthesis glycosyltransferase